MIRSFDFSSLGGDVTHAVTGAYPNIGWFPGSSGNPKLDTAQGLSAVRFDVPGKSGSNAGGEWYINFSPDLATQFDGGDEFFVQWRQRFNTAMIQQYITGGAPRLHGSGLTFADPTAIKQVIISSQDQPGVTFNSCTELELVATSYLQRRFSTLYQACGVADPLIDKNPIDGNDFRLQNAMPAPYCTMYGSAEYNTTSVPAACAGWVADEWMTFQVGVKLGRRDNTLDRFVGSHIRMWVAREGKPSQLIIDIPSYNIHSGPGGPGLANQKYGKAWFGPYMTDKDPTIDHPTMTTWVAEFIVSRQPVADPVVGTLPAGAATSAAPTSSSLATLPSGRVRNLGPWSDGSVAGIARTDYSGTAIGNGQVYLFGGAHGPAIDDDIRAFQLATLQWSSLYPPTPASQMIASNQDATLGRWISSNHPMVRHTYNAQVVIGRKFYLITQGGGSEYPSGTVCWYDLDAKTWSYSKIGHPDWYYASAASVDPISQKVVIVGTDTGASNFCHVWLYDPVADTVQKIVDVTVGTGYSFDLVYLPTRDSFLAIQSNNTLWEIKLNRASPTATTVSLVTAVGGPPAAVDEYPARWRWNGKILTGCIIGGKVSTLDPAAWQWGSVQMKSEDGADAKMLQAFYCFDYDPSSGCSIFLARDGNTYAFRM